MGRFSILILGLFLSACEKQPDKILADRNYTTGDWLLVNWNYVDNTIFIIDNEEILKTNPDNIKILPQGQCGETTCDGFLRLYKDGKLIEEMAYLHKSGLYESDDLTSNYLKGKTWKIEAFDKNDFDLKWDSINRIERLYPTIYPIVYHAKPSDKNIILVYEFEM